MSGPRHPGSRQLSAAPITLALIDAQILSEIRECAARPGGHDHYYTDAGTLRCHDCDLEERA